MLLIELLEKAIIKIKQSKKSNSHQITGNRQINYASLEKIWELSSMRLGNRLTRKDHKMAKLKEKCLFLETKNFKKLEALDFN